MARINRLRRNRGFPGNNGISPPRIDSKAASWNIPKSGTSNRWLNKRGFTGSILGKGLVLSATFGLGAKAALSVSRFGEGMMKGMYPRSSYPLAYGKHGFRTAAQAGPAGINGLKFNFRRKGY